VSWKSTGNPVRHPVLSLTSTIYCSFVWNFAFFFKHAVCGYVDWHVLRNMYSRNMEMKFLDFRYAFLVL